MAKRGIALPHLKAWRDWAYLSQSQLAARAEIHEQTIKNIERGRFGGTQTYTAQAIAQALGISVHQLAEEEPPASHRDCTPLEDAVKPLVEYIVAKVMERLQEVDE
jgi:DNA-binding XRE family transcriptional regulator